MRVLWKSIKCNIDDLKNNKIFRKLLDQNFKIFSLHFRECVVYRICAGKIQKVWPKFLKISLQEVNCNWIQMCKKKYFFCFLSHVKTQRKVMSDSRELFVIFCPPPPLLQWGSSKRYNFFSIGSLLSLEKYVRQKFSLCLFSKTFLEFVCFPPLLPPFFKRCRHFWLKLRILVGNTQTKIFFKKMKCLSVWDASAYLGFTKSFKLE